MRTPLQILLLAAALLAMTPNRALAANYTMPLINNTGLDPTQFSIYAMGFSVASQLVMGSNGTFAPQSSGIISSYQVGAGGLSQITLDTNTAFTGGRLYFFVVSQGSSAPSVTYGTQPTNPPDPSFPPYTIVEITVPAPNPGPLPATIDVQTVDGFIFPLTITLNNQINVAGQQYGQPVYTLGQPAPVNRADIFTAYTNFMQGEGTAGLPYLNLTFGSVAGQPGGILNPGAYLSAIDQQNQFLNLGSPLNTVFNADLTTLFSTTTLKVQGVASAAGDSPPAIFPQSYTVTPVTQTYPNTSVSLPALQFTGVTNPSNVFYVFNPVGLSVLTNDAGGAIKGTIQGATLTLNSPASALQNGMYVSGAGISPTGSQSTTTIIGINGNVVTLSGSFGSPAPNSQYVFSKLPFLIMFQTPGQMVFGNSGVFADNTVQFLPGTSSATVLGSLENFLVAALNRGVALNPAALNPVGSNGTSAVWGNQMNWYPTGATQNLFSLFMHVGQSNGVPIFFQPASATQNALGQTMGSAYGFAFDENGGPVPPAPAGPEVPSKFDGNVPVGATIQITFGQWAQPGGTFVDVPPGSPFFTWIEALVAAGITGGCQAMPPLYCPNQEVTRAQMAVFLLRGIAYPGAASPPPATGTVFADVPASYPLASWVEALYAAGITGGCGTNPLRYCPDASVTRGSMAVFLLRAKHGPAFIPPVPTQQTFADVPLDQVFAAWIYQLAAEGITGGCGGGNYCPNQAVTRAQMAVFLVRTFNLPM